MVMLYEIVQDGLRSQDDKKKDEADEDAAFASSIEGKSYEELAKIRANMNPVIGDIREQIAEATRIRQSTGAGADPQWWKEAHDTLFDLGRKLQILNRMIVVSRQKPDIDGSMSREAKDAFARMFLQVVHEKLPGHQCQFFAREAQKRIDSGRRA
jgi:hypothetical protein